MIQQVRNYPAKFELTDKGGYVVTFRDVPEAITQGIDAIDAVTMAIDALYTAREFYLEDKRPMALASIATPDEVLIPLYVNDTSEVLALFSKA